MYQRGAKKKAVKILAASLIVSMTVPSGIAWADISDYSVLENMQEISETADFEALREKWKVLLTGGDTLAEAGTLAEDYAAYVNELAGQHWNSMIKLGETQTDERTCLFSDLPLTDKKTKTGSSQITLTFDRLKAIVLAYETQGSEYYQREDVKREIIAALDLMIKNHYSLEYACEGTGTSANGGSFGNWYDWRIGTPRQLCDLLLMISDELTAEQIDRYTAPIMKNNKKVDTTGANRTWIANIFIQTGILRGEGELIEAGKAGVKDVFKYVTSGDGFYEDGSFIQHGNYAYTGGYGKALLCTMAPMMYVLNNTEYEISYENQCEQIFYDMIFEAYEPLIYGGRFMDMAREREISRIANQDSIPGRQAIRSIIMLLDVLPAEQQERGYRMVKEWLSDEEVLAQVCIDPVGGYNEYYLPAGVIQMAVDIVNSDVVPRGSLIQHKRYGAMDRIVHLRDKFGFTVSMSSKRIKNTEGTNDEGLRLWHIGDGLTYLYNDDKTYYSDNYWATVDHQRLPGTTVNRVPERAPKEGYGTFNPYDFAGGTDLGEYGIAGMELQGVGTSKRNGAHSRKSWFMFDDEIVAVGSDIRSTLSGSPVETIVENRKLNMDKSNVLTVNGELQEFTDNGEPHEETNQVMKVTTVTKASGKDVRVKTPVSHNVENGQKITFTARIKMPEANNFFALKLYGSAGENEKNLLFLSMRNGAMVPRIRVDGKDKDAYSTDAALAASEWHEVKAELDLGAQTYNYYFDGKHITQGTSVDSNTVTADLENAAFYQSFSQEELAEQSLKLSGFEIMTPGNGTGTILVDDISISCGDTVLLQENFEDDQSGALSGEWTVTKNDPAAEAGAEVYLDTVKVIPQGSDDFNGLHKDTEWIHLEGNTQDSSVGYYFPGKADIQGKRETRLGNWNLVNIYEKFRDDEERMNSFATFWFEHGEKPEKEKYSYAVLPGMTAEETAAYNENPDIEIIMQTEAVHAVKEKNLGITGINFFEPGTCGALSVTQPESVMMRENEDGTVEISFADPTQTQTSLSLAVALPIVEIISMDEEITASDDSGIMVFTAESSKSARAQAGRSWKVTVRLGGNDNMFETMELGSVPEYWKTNNGKAVVAEGNGGHVLELTASEQGLMTAETELTYPEAGGAALKFQFKPEKGNGTIFLGDGEKRIPVLNFGSGEDWKPEQWHDIKIKINQETGCFQIMADGVLHGEIQKFEGSPQESLSLLTLEMEDGSKVQLDNLIVREAVVTPPSVPKNLTYTTYGDTFVELQWDPVESENPVYYILSVNGEELETQVNGNTYRVEGLEPEELCEIMVCSTDNEDNRSAWSSPLSVKLLEKQQPSRYVINFNGYKAGTVSQHGWAYAGKDPKGKIEVLKAPEGEKSHVSDSLITDLEYQKHQTASPSNAEYKATASNADFQNTATSSNADFFEIATSSNAKEQNDQALYVYSGTAGSGIDKNAAYEFDKQTEEQIYEMDIYLDESSPYTNIALCGSNGKQAVTMMISDGGIIGYRAGDAPSKTVELLEDKVEEQWIHLVITADPKTQRFSISANGTEVENLKFRNAASDIKTLKINAPGGGTGGIYVDNIILPASADYGKWTAAQLDEELPEELEVPCHTAFEDLGLPQNVNVEVISPEGETDSISVRVNWNSRDYNGEESGSYTIHGTLALPVNYINKVSDSDLKIRVRVEKEIPVYHVTLVQSAGGTIESDALEAEEGTEITLSAQPDEGYELAYWLINGKRKGEKEEVYTIDLTEDLVVSAVFEAKDIEPEITYYRVDIPEKVVGGRLHVNSAYAREGTEIVVTVLPDEGYVLRQLKVDGRIVEVDENNQYVFVLEGNTRISVSFKQEDSGSTDQDGSDHSSRDDRHDDGSSQTTAAPEAAYADHGTWKMTDARWQFCLDDSNYVKGRWACIFHNGAYYWYHFDADGFMETGWLTINGQTFYLSNASDHTIGRMATGWQQIDGKWYWFQNVSDGNKGVLLKNGVTPDGFQVGEDGAWK